MIREELKNYFEQLESKIEPIKEFSLGEKIEEILKAKQKIITDKNESAEYIAFKFMAHYSNKENGWGTYYGPMIVWKNDRGQFIEFPSIQQIDEDILNYWRIRIKKSKHPILACRYADLVFDFEPIVLEKTIDFEIAQKVIDSTIEICEKKLDDGLGCKSKLERALALTIQINDNRRLHKLADLIIKTEDKFAEDNKPGTWGYALKWLLLDKAEKISLPEKQQKQLIDDMELRLSKLMSVKDPDPWHVECAVKLLAEYYARSKDQDALKAVLNKLESAFRKNKYVNSDGMLISNYLEKLIEIYLQYSSFEFAKDARKRIINELSNLGERGKFATKQISTEISIKKKDIDQFIKSLFGAEDTDLLEKVIARIAVNFILRKKLVENQLNDLSKNYPISYLASHVIASEEGYPIAKFSSINEDYSKHLLENFSRNLHFQVPILRIAFDELTKRYKPDKVLAIILLSPVFRANDKDYIFKLLKSFWNKDYLICCCLSVPLIEDAIRNLYRINNQTFIKPNDDGGYDVLGLGRLLRRGLIKAVYQTLGEDIENYFRILLTERIGWNLRNNFAHGINKRLFESEDVAGRLLHVLLCLSLIRDNEKSFNN